MLVWCFVFVSFGCFADVAGWCVWLGGLVVVFGLICCCLNFVLVSVVATWFAGLIFGVSVVVVFSVFVVVVALWLLLLFIAVCVTVWAVYSGCCLVLFSLVCCLCGFLCVVGFVWFWFLDFVCFLAFIV